MSTASDIRKLASFAQLQSAVLTALMAQTSAIETLPEETKDLFRQMVELTEEVAGEDENEAIGAAMRVLVRAVRQRLG